VRRLWVGSGMTDDEILARLLELNQKRAGSGARPG
jgi:hypothetical protein